MELSRRGHVVTTLNCMEQMSLIAGRQFSSLPNKRETLKVARKTPASMVLLSYRTPPYVFLSYRMPPHVMTKGHQEASPTKDKNWLVLSRAWAKMGSESGYPNGSSHV